MYILFLVMISGYGFGALTALPGSWGRSGRALTATGTVAGAVAGLMLGMASFRSRSPFSVLIPSLLPVAGGLLQSGSLHGYVAYLFIALVVMLGLLLAPGR